MKIDRIFIINLEHRQDRKTKMMEELSRVGIEQYEFFKAIRPTKEIIKQWNPDFLNPIPNWFKQTGGDETKYKMGSLGCMLSHLEIIKMCIKKNYENVLILEDDTEFHIGDGITFGQIFDMLQNQISQLDFGLLYFAGNHRGSMIQKYSENLNYIKGSLTTGSYIINKSAMKYIIDNIKSYPREIDVFYSTKVQGALKCYCLTPHLTKQAEGYSDIVQKHVSYKL
jgi:glycosyl transferase, family 25